MESIQLFALASRQAEWLSTRQTLVSGNIANANTPGFRAKESPTSSYVVEPEVDEGSAAQLSGNSVDLSEELMKQGSIKRDYDLNAAIVKSFNKMMLMTVRKG